ncbi:hypothetical protein [Nocardioides sp. zg-DK7169]|uniref:hypothetical protein n=1 Tax=Nocardioides sp. zg-DK7169 TaxID=2736600 RepID=UPI001555BD29|nr:hypothetical protein [Nocardioides sp. zg-DK7169]NPC97834.1 hypothetical protein [Nocardioides sp. zg-DK7169]
MFGRRVVLLVVLAMLAGVLALGGPAQAESRPTLGPPSAFDAPIGQRGGAMNPAASCGDGVEPARMRWSMKNVKTGRKVRFGWFDGYPGMRFPRLKVGTYASFAVVKCGSSRTARRDRFTIHQKTRRSTISRAEFTRIKDGMTLRQVRAIVGNRGVWPFTYDGTTSRTFHQMRFWAWSIIRFKNGRVVDTWWNVGHD